jgi:thiosulfate/3-mercaptopyruvate sulfurtransferase
MIMQDDDVTKFKSPEEIRDKFKEAGIIFGSNVITSCGSGVTAATLTFALYLLGKNLDTSPIYDGSWSEWGGINTNLPVTK